MGETLVLLEVTDDRVVAGPCHEPAVAIERQFKVENQRRGFRWVSLEEQLSRSNGFAQFEWESLCGARGWLYADCAVTRKQGVCVGCQAVLVQNELAAKAAA